MPTDSGVWETGDEIRFLKQATPSGMTKLEFLQNYKEGLCERNNWGLIDKKKLFRELNKQIQQETKGV